MKKRILIITLTILLICFLLSIIYIKQHNQNKTISTSQHNQNKTISTSQHDQQIDNSDLEMLERYLTNKYNKTFKVKDYSFIDNGDLGFYAGKHYSFTFAPIDGLDVLAYLDYFDLTEEYLEYLNLNITNIDRANELKSYVETNFELTCNIKEFQESTDNYGYFQISFGNNDIYSISGKIYDGEEIESAIIIKLSDALKNKISIEVNNQTTISDIIQAYKSAN